MLVKRGSHKLKQELPNSNQTIKDLTGFFNSLSFFKFCLDFPKKPEYTQSSALRKLTLSGFPTAIADPLSTHRAGAPISCDRFFNESNVKVLKG
jgi:hypothetical protein